MYIIIQSRTNSTRFPNKAMAHLAGEPLVKHCYDLCASVSKNVIVAIPFEDPLKDYFQSICIPYFEGTASDVLTRYYHCAKAYRARWIVRITADCPMIDQATLAWCMAEAEKHNLDWYTNEPTVDGQEIQIMSMRCLEWAYNKTPSGPHREHVTTWIKTQHDKMRQMGFSMGQYISPFPLDIFPKMSVDTPEDLKRMEVIYAKVEAKKLLSARL